MSEGENGGERGRHEQRHGACNRVHCVVVQMLRGLHRLFLAPGEWMRVREGEGEGRARMEASGCSELASG